MGALISTAQSAYQKHTANIFPGSNNECKELYTNFIENGDPQKDNDLLKTRTGKDKGIKTTKEIDFQRQQYAHSRKLMGIFRSDN